MDLNLIRDVFKLLEDFSSTGYAKDITGFKQWLYTDIQQDHLLAEPEWEGKQNGRSPESVINTLLLRMNRYAKRYSKSAIYNSDFSTQEEFIYLINLKTFGKMAKIALIKKNLQDKTVGMQIINRMIARGWIVQRISGKDKRSKVIQITPEGLNILEKQMVKIRQATNIVTGDLNHTEKMDLIRLLHKLEKFHHPIFCSNIDSAELLEKAIANGQPYN